MVVVVVVAMVDVGREVEVEAVGVVGDRGWGRDAGYHKVFLIQKR